MKVTFEQLKKLIKQGDELNDRERLLDNCSALSGFDDVDTSIDEFETLEDVFNALDSQQNSWLICLDIDKASDIGTYCGLWDRHFTRTVIDFVKYHGGTQMIGLIMCKCDCVSENDEIEIALCSGGVNVDSNEKLRNGWENCLSQEELEYIEKYKVYLSRDMLFSEVFSYLVACNGGSWRIETAYGGYGWSIGESE